METGTGKTYVYLRTIYELYKVYGFKKFVIVAPSVAIREGAVKNPRITHEHFQALCGCPATNFLVYDSRKLAALRNFATSNAIQVREVERLKIECGAKHFALFQPLGVKYTTAVTTTDLYTAT